MRILCLPKRHLRAYHFATWPWRRYLSCEPAEPGGAQDGGDRNHRETVVVLVVFWGGRRGGPVVAVFARKNWLILLCFSGKVE